MSGREIRARLLDHARIDHGKHFRLADHDPAEKSGLDKEAGRNLLEIAKERLETLQGRLAAQGQWSVLMVLQAMDAGGKDGTIKHVMSGVNPQGVEVTSFKQPGPEALSRDFLWRIHQRIPARGRIGVFNRSHYEEMLVCRVHPRLLDAQNLPSPLRDDPHFWDKRADDIVAFERYLGHQGVIILKFFLHIGRDEQRARLAARLEDPDKNWKFSDSDLAERGRWDDYQDAYERMIATTATPHAPWFVVPADHKWHARLVVIEALVQALERLDPRPPAATADLDAAREALGVG